jgi:hypothetical protein
MDWLLALAAFGLVLWQAVEHAYLKGFKDGTAWADGRPFDEKEPRP